jgi:hypothetical protein
MAEVVEPGFGKQTDTLQKREVSLRTSENVPTPAPCYWS